jgi:hypothetical protein
MGAKVVRIAKKARKPERQETMDPEQARITASEYIVRHYPFGCTGGTAYLLPLAAGDYWVVPIVLTSPGYGAVGAVGIVALNACTGDMVSGTPAEQVRKAVQRLKENKHDALDAAFLQAREG